MEIARIDKIVLSSYLECISLLPIFLKSRFFRVEHTNPERHQTIDHRHMQYQQAQTLHSIDL